jgi:hypothetical protein
MLRWFLAIMVMWITFKISWNNINYESLNYLDDGYGTLGFLVPVGS